MIHTKQLTAILLTIYALTANGQITFNLDVANRGQKVSDDHYGIFFEEINHAGDGGLYAELIRNRSMEDDLNSPTGWSAMGNVAITLTADEMLNTVQRRALKVDIKSANGGVRNEGYWGINIVKGRTYDLSFWMRAQDQYDGIITAELQTGSGRRIGYTAIDVEASGEWQKITATITATASDERGCFALRGSKAGIIYLDVVSLFPPTFKNRINGCRPDLAQMLADLHPRFMRFPGGCYIEGEYADGRTNRFEWKKTVGPIEERPGHFNRNWGYQVTDGLGYHECLQLAEDLGTSALFVANMGIGHNWKVDENNIDPFVQEALDAIEYARGSATDTFYGRMRAHNGHTEPFDLKYMEIGNEQEFMLNRDDYMKRYMQFYRAIKAKWPDMHIVADSYYFDNVTEPVELKDEHYYDSPEFFISQYGRYDNQSASSTKIYVGEYAVTKDCGWWGNMNAAIGEAVFMQGCENNSEAVTMMSYAPIFTHEENYAWHPDMIRFDASTSYGTPSYYVQRMFMTGTGRQNIRWTETGNEPISDSSKGCIGLGTWATRATFTGLTVTATDTTFVARHPAATDWQMTGGTWTLTDSTFRQTDGSATNVTCIFNHILTTTNVDMTVNATKNGGDEGFLIIFDYKDTDNYTWFNIGGWGNTKHAVEQCKDGVKTTLADAAGTLQTGRQYTIRVKKDGQRVRCYIDGQLIIDTTLKETASRQIYASANIDEEAGMLYVKLVNPHGKAATIDLNIAGARALSAEAEVLSAARGTDENTPANPNNITPRTKSVTVGTEGSVRFAADAYSVNVLRLRVTDVIHSVAEPLPEPRLRFSFDNGTPTDDSGTYTGRLCGKAAVVQQSDGNYVLSTGLQGESSYMDIPVEAVKNALDGATEYTISLNLLQRIDNNTDRYAWALSFDNGTDSYFGLINAGGNNNWYCELKTGGQTTDIQSWSCLRIAEWHNITYVQKADSAWMYVDGQLRRSQTSALSLPAFIVRLKNASIGHSPYAADAIMEHALFDDLQVFDTALDMLQVQSIAAQTAHKTDDDRYTDISFVHDFETLVAEVRNYYRDADNADLTLAYNNAARAISGTNVTLKKQRYEQLLSAVSAWQESQTNLAQSHQPANLTFLITNSSFTRTGIGWQGADIPAVRTSTDIMATYAGYTNETAEQFDRPFDIWQELTHMPSGTYELTANAFYRAGAIAAAYEAWQNDTPEARGAELYLGDAATPLLNLYSLSDYTYSPYQYPDNLTAASVAFNTYGRYAGNSVRFGLTTDDSTLRLGIRKRQAIAADWVAFDHFQLHYLGHTTGIAATHGSEASGVGNDAIYNLLGQRMSALQKGINIVGNKLILIK